MAPSSRIVAAMSGDRRCHVRPTRAAACDAASAGRSSVTEIVDTIVEKLVSIRGGKVEVQPLPLHPCIHACIAMDK